MRLFRIQLRPLSPWRTPWQADTLLGALCATAARVRGADVLRDRLIAPMLAGQPPFVLSDALPADLLPVPAAVRCVDPPAGADRKAVKRGRWLTRADFLALREGHLGLRVPWDRLLADADVLGHDLTRHNTLARDSDASLEAGGLFARVDTHVHAKRGSQPALTLYFRAADDSAAGLLLDLLHELSLVGFGADTATGRGHFEISGDPVPDVDLDEPPEGANGVVVLSTFQPAPGNPADGFWDIFPKFGMVGPDLGLHDVRKHTLIMFRPGSSFRTEPATPFLGRALPMDDVLPAPTASSLRNRGVEIIHPAFGLAVPIGLPWNDEARP